MKWLFGATSVALIFAVCGAGLIGCAKHRHGSSSSGGSPNPNQDNNSHWTGVATLDSGVCGQYDASADFGPGFFFDPQAGTQGVAQVMGGYRNGIMSSRSAVYDLTNVKTVTINNKDQDIVRGIATSPSNALADPTIVKVGTKLFAFRAIDAIGSNVRKGFWRYKDGFGWNQDNTVDVTDGYYFVYKDKLYRIIANHPDYGTDDPSESARFEVFDDPNWTLITDQDLDLIPYVRTRPLVSTANGLGVLAGDHYLIFGGETYPSGPAKANDMVIDIDLAALLADPTTGATSIVNTLTAPTNLNKVRGQVLWADADRVFLWNKGDGVSLYKVTDNTLGTPGYNPNFPRDEYLAIGNMGQPDPTTGKTYAWRSKGDGSGSASNGIMDSFSP